MIALHKTIAYTKSWKHTLWIALLLGATLPLLLITLEPFDNSNRFSYKYVILSGYALCIVVPVLCIHLLENYVYAKQKNRWFIINECLYIAVTLFLILICCFFYHFYIVSDLSVIIIENIWYFMSTFGLPFVPIFIPLWVYLRSKYGIIEVPFTNTKEPIEDQLITIQGESKSETLTILESNFIYAQAQQNYVDVYYNTIDGIQQQLIRSTLSNMMKQLPNAWQVHRSYLVNIDYLDSVEGNTRKRFMTLTGTQETIPISQKYYVALTKRLANLSQVVQN